MVAADGELVGQTIEESGLDELDIAVLTLQRGTSVIPNPRRRRVIEAEDRLLCFGRMETMKELIPARPKRKRRVRKLPQDAGGADA